MHRWAQHREAARRAMTDLLCAAELQTQSALEQPAIISVVARWLDDARVVAAP